MFPLKIKSLSESSCPFPLDLYCTLPSLAFALIPLNCGLQGYMALAVLQSFSNLSHHSAPPCCFSYTVLCLTQGSDIIVSGSPEGAKSCPRMSKGCMT